MNDYLEESDWMRFTNFVNDNWDGPLGKAPTSQNKDLERITKRMMDGRAYHLKDFTEILILQNGKPKTSFSGDLYCAGKYARDLYRDTNIPVECRYVIYRANGDIEDKWIYFFEDQNQSVGEYIICFLEHGVNGRFLAGLWDMTDVNIQHLERSARGIARKQERKEARSN